MKNNQSGRSMIEMIGVIAIIGVLSTAGLGGYTKAMNSHKDNLLLSQVSEIMTGLKNYKMRSKTYSGIDSTAENGTKAIKKLELVAADMISGNTIIHAQNGYITLKSATDGKSLDIGVNGLTKDTCVKLVTSNLGNTTVSVDSSTTYNGNNISMGDAASMCACTSCAVKITMK